MGLSPESPLMRAAVRAERRGIALPAILFAIIVIAGLGSVSWVMTDLNARAIDNREDAMRARHIAESGASHALGLLRGNFRDTTLSRLLKGSDNLRNTADDGRLTGYALPVGSWLPADGVATEGGMYYAKLTDDPAETDNDPLTDKNMRVLLNCRGVAVDGSTAEINLVIANLSLPGLAVEDGIKISGKLKLKGACGGIHANGDATGGGEPTVTTKATATGNVSVNVSPKLSNQPPLDIPDLNPQDYCNAANFFIVGNFELKSSSASGTYCVTGNVTIATDIGSALFPKKVSIIATGAIKISSKPFLTAAHPDGILLMAGGDFDFQGDWGGSGDDDDESSSWEGDGLLYAGGHCYVSSKPVINGQLICKGKSDPPGAIDYTDSNEISGDAEITYKCGSILGETFRVTAWYPTFGS